MGSNTYITKNLKNFVKKMKISPKSFDKIEDEILYLKKEKKCSYFSTLLPT